MINRAYSKGGPNVSQGVDRIEHEEVCWLPKDIIDNF